MNPLATATATTVKRGRPNKAAAQLNIGDVITDGEGTKARVTHVTEKCVIAHIGFVPVVIVRHAANAASPLKFWLTDECGTLEIRDVWTR